MTTWHAFKRGGKHYRVVHDEAYQTRGSYAYDTEEETRAAEEHELERLASGAWVVVGCIVTEPCDNDHHCSSCTGRVEVDSLWGMVIPDDVDKAERLIPDLMGHGDRCR